MNTNFMYFFKYNLYLTDIDVIDIVIHFKFIISNHINKNIYLCVTNIFNYINGEKININIINICVIKIMLSISYLLHQY